MEEFLTLEGDWTNLASATFKAANRIESFFPFKTELFLKS